ncbi:YrhK family protein [Palleronia sp. LCG004]|uniref:YrhK family protein n=1 Tax=Palleronia sp. LCG004 TaxID=3079304 RepID=UPI002942D713|nr:YrhK family protein [Palleronia sp. LCG004]WOI56475.1 YrhK family protein [Palleronia sp. LCG004]
MAWGLFRHENRQKSERSKRFYARVEIAYTFIDFSAAILFLAGSIMFFWSSLETPAIWCFTVGSVAFAVKPTLRLFREVRLAAMGDDGDISARE